MIYRTTPKFVSKFADIIEKRIVKIELVFISIGVMGILVRGFQEYFGELILTFSFSALACAYYFLAFRQSHNNYDRFISKLMNFSYSASILSILFILLNWPGGIFMYQVAAIAILGTILSIIILDKVLKRTSGIDNVKIIRTFIFLVLLLLLILSSEYKQLNTNRNEENKIIHNTK